jgi:phage gp46-like protein
MIKLSWNNENQAADLELVNGRITTDDGLDTAVTISILTDARADEGDDVDEMRGWWGDSYPAVPGDKTGSKLWQALRKKATAGGLRMVQEWAQSALRWMIVDKAASSVDVVAEYLLAGTTPIGIVLNIAIAAPSGERWSKLWEIRYGI